LLRVTYYAKRRPLVDAVSRELMRLRGERPGKLTEILWSLLKFKSD
jgi:hypothetical protein